MCVGTGEDALLWAGSRGAGCLRHRQAASQKDRFRPWGWTERTGPEAGTREGRDGVGRWPLSWASGKPTVQGWAGEGG